MTISDAILALFFKKQEIMKTRSNSCLFSTKEVDLLILRLKNGNLTPEEAIDLADERISFLF